MKLFTNKGFIKKIVIADADEDFGGRLFRPICEFFAGGVDLIIKGLQKTFTGNGDIGKDDEHVIKYGPAAIFSNVIPGLDANFINPKYTEAKPYKVEQDNEEEKIDSGLIER